MQVKNRKIKYLIMIGVISAIFIAGLIAEILSPKNQDQKENGPTQDNELKGEALSLAQDLFREENVREPAAAGTYYPNTKGELEGRVNDLLNASATTSDLAGEIVGLFVPHAGFDFSGAVQAAAYKLLIGQEKKIKTVILLGASHIELFEGISIYPQGFFKTPLGKVKIDSLLAQALIAENEKIFFKEGVHTKEHSLEVQIPFLQKVLPNAQIVPIIIGDNTLETINVLARAILAHLTEDTILIASSDLAHYPPQEIAIEADRRVLDAILTGDPNRLVETLQTLNREDYPQMETFLCAEAAVETLLAVLDKQNSHQAHLLKYANSGDTAPNKRDRVVGYGAIAFTAPQRFGEYSPAERQALLDLARISVENYVRTGKLNAMPINSDHLQQPRGAFVTLSKNGALRGCIGHLAADQALTQTVQETAVRAAFDDKRFTPLQAEELDEITYEISILSPLVKIFDPYEIVLGRHGVVLIYAGRQGVYLPQVALENDWTLETFFNQLCLEKLGLELNCWQKPEAEIWVFTAEVF